MADRRNELDAVVAETKRAIAPLVAEYKSKKEQLSAVKEELQDLKVRATAMR